VEVEAPALEEEVRVVSSRSTRNTYSSPASRAQGEGNDRAARPLCCRRRRSRGEATQPPQRGELPQNLKTVVMITSIAAMVWAVSLFELFFSLATCKETIGCWNSDLARSQILVVITAAVGAWFAGARLLLFLVPSVADYASRGSGRSFRQSCIASVFLRSMPHYILVALAGWLFLKELWAIDPTAGPLEVADSSIRTYSFVAFAISALCAMLGIRHNNFLDGADAPRPDGQRGGLKKRKGRAPRDTVDKLATQRYDPAVFGDGDGKAFPADCAICLCSYEADDEIKVTPCGHAFHKDCIAHWLKTAHTCALCRADLADLVASTSMGYSTASTSTAGSVATNSTEGSNAEDNV
jgi:hypothetical protein